MLKLCALESEFTYMGDLYIQIPLQLHRQQVDCSAERQPIQALPAHKTPLTLATVFNVELIAGAHLFFGDGALQVVPQSLPLLVDEPTC